MSQLNLPQRIETDRLLLQRLRYEDAEEIFYSYASKVEVTRYLTWPTHQSVQETRRFLDYVIAAWEKGIDYSYSIRLKDSGIMIGSFGIMNDQGKVSFGYCLSPNYWSKGCATEACIAVMGVLKTLPGIYRIWTVVDVDNVGSSKVLLKSGLVLEARLANWFKFINQDNQPKDCFIYYLPENKII